MVSLNVARIKGDGVQLPYPGNEADGERNREAAATLV